MPPPRGFTNPAPKTESAREAVKSFYCELCSKGYSRMPDFEAHESSYDHQHKKRLKEMKQMQKDPSASTRARKAERRADEKSGLITIKPMKLGGSNNNATNLQGSAGGNLQGKAGAGGGFRRGGFKSAFGAAEPVRVVGVEEAVGKGMELSEGGKVDLEVESEEEGEYEMYDPRRPTECWEGCPGRVG